MGCGGSKPAQNAEVATDKKPAKNTEVATDKTLMNRTTESKNIAEANQATSGEQPHKTAKIPTVFKDVVDIFDRLDANGDGAISAEEPSKTFQANLDCSDVGTGKTLRTLIAESGLNPFFYVFDQLDTNDDGKITRDEFESTLHPTKAASHIEDMFKKVFSKLDANKDGNISREDLKSNLSALLETSHLQSRKNMRKLLLDAGFTFDFDLFDQLDANHAGKITWEEFQAKLQGKRDVKGFLKRVFDRLDANCDGHVSKEELSASLASFLDCSDLVSKKTFRALVAEADLNAEFYVFEQLDTNQDGKITWEEFDARLKPSLPHSQDKDLVDASTECVAQPQEDILIDNSTKTTVCCV